MSPSPRIFSIIIPVYFNEASLETLHARLAEQAGRHPQIEHEFVFVDDGSEDRSFDVLAQLARLDARVRVVRLTRNFGSHNACLAGFTTARGDCAALISADLQEPADLPWQLLERWGPESPVVIATRASRDEEVHKVAFARLYFRTMRWLAFAHWPQDGFDCFLIDRRVLDYIIAFDERNAPLTGLVLWTGFRFSTVAYDRLRRPHGASRWTVAKRVKLFADSVIAFSYAPVRAVSAVGILLGIIGFLYAGVVLVRRVMLGVEVSGWSSLMMVLLVVSGVQLVGLGILGEYLWRTLDAARRRPNFVVAETRNVERASDTPR